MLELIWKFKKSIIANVSKKQLIWIGNSKNSTLGVTNFRIDKLIRKLKLGKYGFEIKH